MSAKLCDIIVRYRECYRDGTRREMGAGKKEGKERKEGTALRSSGAFEGNRCFV